MQEADLTLTLDGEVTLEDFSKAMQRFKEIVVGLQGEVAPGAHIEWVIDDLKKKCATARVRGIPTTSVDIASIGRVRNAYGELGQRAASGETLPNTESIVQAVVGLRRLINGSIKAVIFESEKKKHVMKKTALFTPVKTHWDTETFGGARGTVESISERQYLHFTLYDYNDDHPITCSYADGNKDKIRGIWGKLVYVAGIVTRDADTDLVNNIRDISSVEVLRERKPHAWREAMGCAK